MPAHYAGFRENPRKRSALPVPHALPFLGSRLVAPWPKARELSPRQAGELRQVLAVLKARAGGCPIRLDWVAWEVTPTASWDRTPAPRWAHSG